MAPPPPVFTFSADFAVMGGRLCWKPGQTRNTGQMAPQLLWSGAPVGTRSFAVSLRDLTNGGIHWVAWDIPAVETMLAAGPVLPPGAQQSAAWYGPGAATVHQYEYKLWALNVALLPPQNPVNKTTLLTTVLPMFAIDSRTVIAWGDQDARCQ
jgi:phosphatidylethanolamine-binding protein (PEBP) family uncharacterized protein